MTHRFYLKKLLKGGFPSASCNAAIPFFVSGLFFFNRSSHWSLHIITWDSVCLKLEISEVWSTWRKHDNDIAYLPDTYRLLLHFPTAMNSCPPETPVPKQRKHRRTKHTQLINKISHIGISNWSTCILSQASTKTLTHARACKCTC